MSLAKSSRFSKLAVSSAGPMCNFLICFLARRLIFLLPIFYHYFGYSRGVVVLADNAAFGLGKGTIINSINHKSLSDLHHSAGMKTSTFVDEYSSLLRNLPPLQHCLPISSIKKTEECCYSSELSLYHRDQVNCIWDLPSLQIYKDHSNFGNIIPKYCGLLLPDFYNTSIFYMCNSHSDCSSIVGETGKDSVCMSPFNYHVRQKLIILNTSSIYDLNSKAGKSIAFISLPSHFFSTVLVGEFVPSHNFLPLSLPFLVYIWLKYLFSLNIGLGILNLAPAFELDGAKMISIFFDSFHHTIFKTVIKIFMESLLIYMGAEALFACFDK